MKKKYILDPIRVKLACTKGNLRTYVNRGLICITDIENGETAIIGNANSKEDHYCDFSSGHAFKKGSNPPNDD